MGTENENDVKKSKDFIKKFNERAMIISSEFERLSKEFTCALKANDFNKMYELTQQSKEFRENVKLELPARDKELSSSVEAYFNMLFDCRPVYYKIDDHASSCRRSFVYEPKHDSSNFRVDITDIFLTTYLIYDSVMPICERYKVPKKLIEQTKTKLNRQIQSMSNFVAQGEKKEFLLSSEMYRMQVEDFLSLASFDLSKKIIDELAWVRSITGAKMFSADGDKETFILNSFADSHLRKKGLMRNFKEYKWLRTTDDAVDTFQRLSDIKLKKAITKTAVPMHETKKIDIEKSFERLIERRAREKGLDMAIVERIYKDPRIYTGLAEDLKRLPEIQTITLEAIEMSTARKAEEIKRKKSEINIPVYEAIKEEINAQCNNML